MRDNCGSAVLQDHPAASVLPQPLLVEFYCQAQEQRTKKRPQAGFVSLSYPRSRAASPPSAPSSLSSLFLLFDSRNYFGIWRIIRRQILQNKLKVRFPNPPDKADGITRS